MPELCRNARAVLTQAPMVSASFRHGIRMVSSQASTGDADCVRTFTFRAVLDIGYIRR